MYSRKPIWLIGSSMRVMPPSSPVACSTYTVAQVAPAGGRDTTLVDRPPSEYAGVDFTAGLSSRRHLSVSSRSWLMGCRLGAGGSGEGFLLFLDPTTRKAVREEKVPMHVHDFALAEDAGTIYTVGHNKVAVYSLG